VHYSFIACQLPPQVASWTNLNLNPKACKSAVQIQTHGAGIKDVRQPQRFMIFLDTTKPKIMVRYGFALPDPNTEENCK